jgi:hypothetical protein
MSILNRSLSFNMARVLAALAVVTLASLGCSSAGEDPPAPEATSTAEQALVKKCPPSLPKCIEPVFDASGNYIGCQRCGLIDGL